LCDYITILVSFFLQDIPLLLFLSICHRPPLHRTPGRAPNRPGDAAHAPAGEDSSRLDMWPAAKYGVRRRGAGCVVGLQGSMGILPMDKTP